MRTRNRRRRIFAQRDLSRETDMAIEGLRKEVEAVLSDIEDAYDFEEAYDAIRRIMMGSSEFEVLEQKMGELRRLWTQW